MVSPIAGCSCCTSGHASLVSVPLPCGKNGLLARLLCLTGFSLLYTVHREWCGQAVAHAHRTAGCPLPSFPFVSTPFPCCRTLVQDGCKTPLGKGSLSAGGGGSLSPAATCNTRLQAPVQEQGPALCLLPAWPGTRRTAMRGQIVRCQAEIIRFQPDRHPRKEDHRHCLHLHASLVEPPCAGRKRMRAASCPALRLNQTEGSPSHGTLSAPVRVTGGSGRARAHSVAGAAAAGCRAGAAFPCSCQAGRVLCYCF